MKIKILVVPLMIVIIIVLLIWFIYPLWTNGQDGIREKLAEYEIQKNRQTELEKKKEKIAAAYRDIESNKSRIDLLYRFLPESMSEEELIDKMQFMTTMKVEEAENGLEAAPGKMTVIPLKEAASIKSDESTAPSTGQNDAVVLVKRDLSNFNLQFGFIGRYEKVRDIIKSIYSLRRFNRVISFKATAGIITREGNILKWEDAGGEPADGLKIEMVMGYNYLNVGQVKPENINDPVFGMEKIKWEAIDAIQKRETDLVPLTLPAGGRGNPFVLPS